MSQQSSVRYQMTPPIMYGDQKQRRASLQNPQARPQYQQPVYYGNPYGVPPNGYYPPPPPPTFSPSMGHVPSPGWGSPRNSLPANINNTKRNVSTLSHAVSRSNSISNPGVPNNYIQNQPVYPVYGNYSNPSSPQMQRYNNSRPNLTHSVYSSQVSLHPSVNSSVESFRNYRQSVPSNFNIERKSDRRGMQPRTNSYYMKPHPRDSPSMSTYGSMKYSNNNPKPYRPSLIINNQNKMQRDDSRNSMISPSSEVTSNATVVGTPENSKSLDPKEKSNQAALFRNGSTDSLYLPSHSKLPNQIYWALFWVGLVIFPVWWLGLFVTIIVSHRASKQRVYEDGPNPVHNIWRRRFLLLSLMWVAIILIFTGIIVITQPKWLPLKFKLFGSRH